MNNFFIKTCDDFFPPYVRREIFVNLLNDNVNFHYHNEITYNKPSAKNNWKKYNNNIMDTEAFTYMINYGSPEFISIEKNVKTFIQAKFNIKVKEILRLMLVYLPPNPSFDDNCILGPHVDYLDKEHMNLLYYLFDNDADTLFFDRLHDYKTKMHEHDYHKVNVHKRIQVKENRAVLFNGLIYHAGNVSKYKKRVTLNINFLPEFTQNS